MARLRLNPVAVRVLAEPERKPAKPDPGTFEKYEPRTPLERLAVLGDRSSYRTPDAGGKGGQTAMDMAHALGHVADRLGAKMAQAIASHSYRDQEEIVAELAFFVLAKCSDQDRHNRKAPIPDLLEVADACELAFYAEVSDSGGDYRPAHDKRLTEAFLDAYSEDWMRLMGEEKTAAAWREFSSARVALQARALRYYEMARKELFARGSEAASQATRAAR